MKHTFNVNQTHRYVMEALAEMRHGRYWRGEWVFGLRSGFVLRSEAA